MSFERFADATRDMLDEMERAVVGKRDVLRLAMVGLLTDGHVLIEDYPGVAKTLIARSLARVSGLRFARIQFTPDVMPADIVGSSVYDQRRGTFEFRPGPVFTNVLLGDEINRAPPKTQAALLEAMQERQVTTEGTTHPLERPFVVIATQNPVEYEGTYPLPEAQLDRFLLRLRVGYPAAEDERTMLARRVERRTEEPELEPVVDRETVRGMQQVVEQVYVSATINAYIVDIVTITRQRADLVIGASPRGSLAVLAASRARAALAGRDFVTPEDVKAMAVPALAHRLALQPEQWMRGVRQEDVVADCLESVATPSAAQTAPTG